MQSRLRIQNTIRGRGEGEASSKTLVQDSQRFLRVIRTRVAGLRRYDPPGFRTWAWRFCVLNVGKVND